MAVWVRFSVQLDYSFRFKSVPSEGENRVRRRMVEFMVFNSAFGRQLTNQYLQHHQYLLYQLPILEYKVYYRENLHGLLRQMGHFLTNMSNRVEHQKLNQTTAELSFG